MSVEQVEDRVSNDEDQEVKPDELDDAAVPDQHHLEEALPGPLRVLITVGEDGFAVLCHLDTHVGFDFRASLKFFFTQKKFSCLLWTALFAGKKSGSL